MYTFLNVLLISVGKNKLSGKSFIAENASVLIYNDSKCRRYLRKVKAVIVMQKLFNLCSKLEQSF